MTKEQLEEYYTQINDARNSEEEIKKIIKQIYEDGYDNGYEIGQSYYDY